MPQGRRIKTEPIVTIISDFIIVNFMSLHPEDGGSMSLRNVGILPHRCMVA